MSQPVDRVPTCSIQSFQVRRKKSRRKVRRKTEPRTSPFSSRGPSCLGARRECLPCVYFRTSLWVLAHRAVLSLLPLLAPGDHGHHHRCWFPIRAARCSPTPKSRSSTPEPTRPTRRLPTASGDYIFRTLPVGEYKLTASAPGFKRYEASNVVTQVNESHARGYRR